MVRAQALILNQSGLHARPAAEFVREAKRFLSHVRIRNLDLPGEDAVNAKNVMAVLSLGIGPGCTVELETEGTDEEDAAQALTALIRSGIGEPLPEDPENVPAEKTENSPGTETEEP